jgi:hypothetical protein
VLPIGWRCFLSTLTGDLDDCAIKKSVSPTLPWGVAGPPAVVNDGLTSSQGDASQADAPSHGEANIVVAGQTRAWNEEYGSGPRDDFSRELTGERELGSLAHR